MINCCIDYKLNIVKDGKSYFYPPAYQLARYISGNYNTYKISIKENWIGAEIYYQQVIRQGSLYAAEKLGNKIQIAYIDYDINLDCIIYHVLTNQDKEFFKLNYSIIKCLRDADWICIKTSEREIRHKTNITYIISKSQLKQTNYKIESEIYGDVLVVPQNAFKRMVGSVANKKRGKNA